MFNQYVCIHPFLAHRSHFYKQWTAWKAPIQSIQPIWKIHSSKCTAQLLISENGCVIRLCSHDFDHGIPLKALLLAMQSLSLPLSIKTHGSVSCGPRNRCATPVSILTGRTIMRFSRICTFVMLVRNRTIFAVEMPSTVSTPHFKFQLNRARHFRDMNFQKLA